MYKVLNLPRVFRLTRGYREYSSLIDVSDEVSTALKKNVPIVALESTIVTHGMPYPQNLNTAKEVEEIIRSKNAIPATIAIMQGRIKVGLSENELSYLADPKTKCVKTSRRDFPYITAMGLNGGTTVSGTLIVANQVGIPIFVTGGIGGVHHGVENTWDISADLRELGRSPVMVVCSGIKSILDIDKSLEFLETEGVLVVKYGNDNIMPSFFSATSNSKSSYNVVTPIDAAKLLQSMTSLKQNSGIVLAVPLPEDYSIDHKVADQVIQQAILEANQNNISGKEVTPFLLEKIRHLTDGKSLESNIALIKNNARVGAEVAVEYFNLKTRSFYDLSHGHGGPCVVYASSPMVKASEKKAVVFGGAVLDSVLTLQQQVKLDGRTVSGKRTAVAGGVGRNLAEALGLLGPKTTFITALGRDPAATAILDSLSHVDTTRIRSKASAETASFTVLVDKIGDCLLVAGDTSIFSSITPEQIRENADIIRSSDIAVIDSNVPANSIEEIVSIASKAGVPTWFEPTDMSICNRVLENNLWKEFTFLSPNILELKTMASHFGVTVNPVNSDDTNQILNEILFLAKSLAGFKNLMVTMGKHGTLILSRRKVTDSVLGPVDSNRNIEARYYPVNKMTTVINASGAGDCGAAAFMVGALAGLDEAQCMAFAQYASNESLKSNYTVPKSLQRIIESSLPPISYTLIPSNQ